ncbi:MAG: hypothetical protein RBS22_01070 [Spongiibacteraceae bacterium]|nr:hypothetical protein [Spongiibacteraceae bacterium]
MKLRLQPWFTDACATFLNNLFKWYPECVKSQISVLEWGGGNSTLYFLGKGCKILTVESDEAYIANLLDISRGLGFKATSVDSTSDVSSKFEMFDLIILKASGFEQVGAEIFKLRQWSIIVNDGISRKDVMDAIATNRPSSIIVLDNVEYSANWGKLERCSAHPDRVRSYRSILRDPNWRHYLFEQPEGRDGHSAADSVGWEAPHRWLSGILWPKDHLLAALMISNIGLPLVTIEGLDDADVETLPERCPFDWSKMEWRVDKYTEVFTLPRNFD